MTEKDRIKEDSQEMVPLSPVVDALESVGVESSRLLAGAVISGQINLLEKMVKVMPSLLEAEKFDPKYGSPLSVACRRRQSASVEHLLGLGMVVRRADVLEAVGSGDPEIFRKVWPEFLRAQGGVREAAFALGDSSYAGMQALVKAVESGSPHMLEEVVPAMGVNPQAFLYKSMATETLNTCPAELAITNDKAAVLLSMIQLGLDANSEFQGVVTAGKPVGLLSRAASELSPRCVKVLLESGADVNAMSQGATALHWVLAVRSEFADAADTKLEVVRALLQAGADVGLKNAQGRSWVQLAGKDETVKEVIRSFIASGALQQAFGPDAPSSSSRRSFPGSGL